MLSHQCFSCNHHIYIHTYITGPGPGTLLYVVVTGHSCADVSAAASLKLVHCSDTRDIYLDKYESLSESLAILFLTDMLVKYVCHHYCIYTPV